MSFTLTKNAVSVVLKNPDSSDVRRVTLNDVRRLSRSGTLLTIGDNDHWVQANYYVYKFVNITNVLHVPPNMVTDFLIDQLKAFLTVYAGLEIEVTTNLIPKRLGYIITPVNEIIAVRPDCSYNVSFEFLEKPV